MGKFKCTFCSANCVLELNRGTRVGELITPDRCPYRHTSRKDMKWEPTGVDRTKCGYCGRKLNEWELNQNEEAEKTKPGYTRPCCYPCFAMNEV